MSVVSAIIDLVTIKPQSKEKKMARSVSVKIPTEKVIEMVESKIASIKEENATYPKRLEAYKKEMNALLGKLVKIAKDNTDNPDVYLSNGYRSFSINISQTLTAGIEFPAQPLDPNGYGRDSQLKELEKTLKLLKLTDQPSVTSSTYNSVLDLL
jgi:chromosome segregation ATPase